VQCVKRQLLIDKKINVYLRQKKSLGRVISQLEEELVPSRETANAIARKEKENCVLQKEHDNKLSVSEGNLRACMMAVKKEQLETKHRRLHPVELNIQTNQLTSVHVRDSVSKDASTNETCTEPMCDIQVCDESVFGEHGLETSLSGEPLKQETPHIKGKNNHSSYSKSMIADDEAVKDITPEGETSDKICIERAASRASDSKHNLTSVCSDELIKQKLSQTKVMEKNAPRLRDANLIPIEHIISELSLYDINEVNMDSLDTKDTREDDSTVTNTVSEGEISKEKDIETRADTDFDYVECKPAGIVKGEVYRIETIQKKCQTPTRASLSPTRLSFTKEIK